MNFIAITMLFCAPLTEVATSQAGGAADASWPQWRGPLRTAHVDAEPWPDGLTDAQLRQQFRIPLSPGYSGPVVDQDLVFITETVEKKSEVVRAFDRTSGEERWCAQWTGAMSVPFFAKANGDWIRSTPACDGERLYVAGMRDVLVCLDARSGKELWRVDFVGQFGTELPAFGFVCSPLLDGNALYVQAGGGVVKLDKRTGNLIWRSLEDGGGMGGSAFSSPVIATLGDVRQLIVQTRTNLAGLTLDTGNPLWSIEVPAFRGMNIVSPLPLDEAVFTSSYGGGTFLFDVTRSSGQFQVEQNWKTTTEGYMSSPVLIDGFVYLHLRNQRFTCIDPRTGESRWTTKPFGKYWSMAVNGRQILALDERGDLLLIEADSSEFRLVDSRKVTDEPAWAHLAVTGNQVFVRSLNALIALGWTH